MKILSRKSVMWRLSEGVILLLKFPANAHHRDPLRHGISVGGLHHQ